MRTKAVVHAEDGLIGIDGITHSPSASPAPLAATGLIMIIWPNLHIRTGVAMGPAVVELESLDAVPSDLAEPSSAVWWEEVVEFTAETAPGSFVAVHGASELPPEGASMAVPTKTSVPSHLRVRVSAAGRQIAPDLVVTEPCEHYLLQFWPVEAGDDLVLSSVADASHHPWSVSEISAESAVVPDDPKFVI